MLKTADIEMKLKEIESGRFQRICNEILCRKGYKPYEYTGSVKGTDKTKLGTPDAVFIDKNGKYIYVEITTQTSRLKKKITDDVTKCLNKIKNKESLYGKVSKIIFMHNNDNPDESFIEDIKSQCRNIKFEIYGIFNLSNILQNECKEIAMSYLELRDYDTQNIKTFSDEEIEKLANAIHEKEVTQYKDNSIKEIKEKINDLYQNAAEIVNNDDALIYISKENRIKLKSIFDSLKAFDFYYKEDETEDSKIYYHNMLVILSKYDIEEGIKYYDSIPKYVTNNFITKHYYAMLLLAKGEDQNANKILESLYFNDNYEQCFETLARSFFSMDKYNEVIKLLSKAKKEQFDRFGFLASMLVISKNKKKQLSEQEILKLNNSKFKNMPIFYSCTSKLLYNLDKRKNKYKEQFKKGLKLLNYQDIVAINTMCNQSMEMGLEEEMISYLESIELSSVLKNKFVELVTNKNELSKKDITLIENIGVDNLDEIIDKNFVLAKIAESKGKELESIKLYKLSYESEFKLVSGFKYVQLSIKNRSTIDEKILLKILEQKDIKCLMMCAQAYNYMGKNGDALNCSYKAIYLAKSNTKYNDAYRQFWSIVMFDGEKNYKKLDHVVRNSVVLLSDIDSNHNINILLEDDNFFEEQDVILGATIARSYSNIGSDLLGLKIKESLSIDNKKYIIKDILDKYTYLVRMCFKYVEENKYLKFFTSEKEKPEEAIKKIKNEMLEVNKDINERLDFYQNNNNVPLSVLISNEYDFDSYAKLINTLLNSSNRIILAGENINISLKDGFVVDISTLIIMTILDILDIIPNEFYDKIYITESLKNKFQYFYENLVRKQDEKENSLFITEEKNLAFSEINVIDQIKFWQKLNKLLNKINVVSIEFEKDDLFNEKTKNLFDKVQFDLIMASQKLDIPFVSDDLMIRKVSNKYGIKHTNLTQIVKEFSTCNDAFAQLIVKLIKHNYIYALYDNTLSEILKGLFENFDSKSKDRFIFILNSIFENKINMDYYIPILLNRLKCMKKVQYIKIFNEVYENLFATFYINTVEETIKKACSRFNIDCKIYGLT